MQSAMKATTSSVGDARKLAFLIPQKSSSRSFAINECYLLCCSKMGGITVLFGARSCQKVGKATLAVAVVFVTLGLILIFMFDLPGSDDVGGGPMTKYKIITTHFQVNPSISSRYRICHFPKNRLHVKIGDESKMVLLIGMKCVRVMTL